MLVLGRLLRTSVALEVRLDEGQIAEALLFDIWRIGNEIGLLLRAIR